jgi:hypothetical protein
MTRPEQHPKEQPYMLKNFLKVSLLIGAAVVLSLQANAQTVVINGIGSSSMFLWE